MEGSLRTSISGHTEVEARVEQVKERLLNFYKPALYTLSIRQEICTKFIAHNDQAWASQVSFTPNGTAQLRSIFLGVVSSLSDHGKRYNVTEPESISGEWVGYRAQDTSSVSTEVPRSEREKFARIQEDAINELTIMYIHGGGFMFGSPSLSRNLTARLSKQTGGRCFLPRYRLSPQSMFPNAPYDILLAFLYLLYPPHDAFHEPVPASSIVLAGESSGANLCMAFVQLLLQIRTQDMRRSIPLEFNSQHVVLPLMAGVIAISGYMDLTDCMPSVQSTSCYFRNPKFENSKDHPHDHIWPASPPRESVYCNDEDLCHPLCSPMIARDWEGAPPMWIGVGEEIVRDSCAVIAQTAARQNVAVWWREYAGVPHCFASIRGLETIPQTLHCLQSWIDFSLTCMNDPRTIASDALQMLTKSFETQAVDVRSVLPMSFQEVESRAKKRASSLREYWHTKGKSVSKI